MSHAPSNSHAIADAECTGVFWQHMREMQPYHNAPNYMSCSGDYHLFLRSGDKVYIEVRNAGEIVISFAELQKNKYLKYYYNLSLMLAIDEHKVMKNEPFNKLYDNIYEYTEDRVWSLETAYIDEADYRAKTYKIIPRGNVCYFKINPFDLEKMEYSTQQELEVFDRGYMNGLVRVKWFSHRMVIYKNIAIEYQVSKMEKELDELLTFFEDKKHILLNLATLNDKEGMNDNILTIIYNKLTNADENNKYEYLVSKQRNCKFLKSIVQISSS
jgi:hypothetical protein